MGTGTTSLAIPNSTLFPTFNTLLVRVLYTLFQSLSPLQWTTLIKLKWQPSSTIAQDNRTSNTKSKTPQHREQPQKPQMRLPVSERDYQLIKLDVHFLYYHTSFQNLILLPVNVSASVPQPKKRGLTERLLGIPRALKQQWQGMISMQWGKGPLESTCPNT